MLNEQLLTLKEATKLPVFRRRGHSVHVSALYRWVQAGIVGRGGQRIKLETIKAPGGLFTSVEAVERFIGRLSGETNLPAPTSAVRQKQITSAEKELVEAGFEIGGMASV